MLRKRLNFLSVVAVIFIFCGFSNSELADIETAIILKDYNQAKKLSRQYLAASSNKKFKNEAQYFLGLSELQLGQYPEARKIFEKLTKQKIDLMLHDKACLGIFDVNYLDENYQEAFDSIKKLLRESPKSEFLSLIYLKAARVNLKLANWDDARMYLKKIVDVFPGSMEVYCARQLLEQKQYFAVQVGAFVERKRAQKLLNELKSKNEYAYIVETKDQQGRKFYRVRIGQLSLLNEARELKLKLSSQGYPAKIYP